MQEYINTGIKDIISRFPRVGAILEEYGIGCGPCSVGICRLGDIVDMHSLSAAQEKELMLRIEAAIHPERGMAATSAAPDSREERQTSYSEPMQRLVDEHRLIKRLLALIPALAQQMDVEADEDVATIERIIDFIRNYADRLHHAKEENILFRLFDDSGDIFQVIYQDHRQGRDHVKGMRAALASRDSKLLARHLLAYAALLTEHIHKEDDILFPWLERKLDAQHLQQLHERFIEEDRRQALNEEAYAAFIASLERRLCRETAI